MTEGTRMTEQERPRTEAGRWLDEIAPELWRQPSNRAMPMDPMQLEIRKAVLAIEEAARTEGRQQAVREIADTLTEHSDHLPITSDGENLRCNPDDAVLVARCSPDILDRAVALNASESPPTCIRCGEVIDGSLCAANGNRTKCTPGDASESGQPPEASDE